MWQFTQNRPTFRDDLINHAPLLSAEMPRPKFLGFPPRSHLPPLRFSFSSIRESYHKYSTCRTADNWNFNSPSPPQPTAAAARRRPPPYHIQIQVGAQTETELKEKKLRVEDALNATKAAVEEGIVVGGGCALSRLSTKVDAIKETLDNDEQKVGADIVKRALSYPMKLIAKNAGVNGGVVSEKVLSNDDPKYGYNVATGTYEDLMAAGIIDPTKDAFSSVAELRNTRLEKPSYNNKGQIKGCS